MHGASPGGGAVRTQHLLGLGRGVLAGLHASCRVDWRRCCRGIWQRRACVHAH